MNADFNKYIHVAIGILSDSGGLKTHTLMGVIKNLIMCVFFPYLKHVASS